MDPVLGWMDQPSKGGQAGWGWALVTGGDGEADEEAVEVASGCGPVITHRGSPAYIGAQNETNNTAELTPR